MRLVFWASVALLGYTYAGYPLWLWLRTHWHLRPVKRAPIFPFVSIVMAVHNEAKVLPVKLKNLANLNYPRDRYDVIVVSDGSTDETNQILAGAASDKLRVMTHSQNQGKAGALNGAIAAAQGEIVVFTDARQSIDSEAVRQLVSNFADPSVGCVSGNLNLGEPGNSDEKGLGLYWRIEKMIRQSEAATGSMVGTTGALYAARKNLLVSIPQVTLLDDVYIPMQVARQGKRVVFESGAIAWDHLDKPPGWEFRRKIRTLVGNYQLIRLAPWLLTTRNPLLFEFVSHKVLRLFGPFMLVGLLLSSLLLPGTFYRSALALQVAFYIIALVALMKSRPALVGRLSDAAFTFVMLNTAALVALLYFVTGKKEVWTR
jgi:poly-beta-1,6-N-acetyl-D-glucosamine synthase